MLFAPLAYPGYDWLRQAVSDLSAAGAPSRALWAQLACLHGPCGLVSVMSVCVYVQGKLTKTLRVGIYFFATMNWLAGSLEENPDIAIKLCDVAVNCGVVLNAHANTPS